MNRPKETYALAVELLCDESTTTAEARCLDASLGELRRREKQRRVLWWGTTTAAVVALVMVAFALTSRPKPTDIAGEEAPTAPLAVPSDKALVTSSPVPTEIVVRSRARAGLVVTNRALPPGLVVTTSTNPDSIRVRSRPSEHLEFLTDQQLFAALEGSPVKLAETEAGGIRAVFPKDWDGRLSPEP